MVLKSIQSECQVKEVGLAASQERREHRRRVLEHQEKINAGQHHQAAEARNPQLTIPLIGEVRRPKPSPPKRQLPKLKKPETRQPELGES
jgi:hypothetical protein